MSWRWDGDGSGDGGIREAIFSFFGIQKVEVEERKRIAYGFADT